MALSTFGYSFEALMPGPISSVLRHHYRHFNAAALIDAADGYRSHLDAGGKMMVTLAGAMSTAELGLSLFLVVVIPTKEMVFAEYLEHNKSLRLSGTLDNLLRNERIARERTFAFLADAGVRYVDALPALRRSMGNELYARTAADMHPNGIGYRVIGEAVFSAMSAGPKAKR
jgi:hypothetical protein